MGDGYQLISGERRLRAMQLANKKTIPAIVRQASEEQMVEWALIENIQREDLNPIDRAKAYKEYIYNFSLSQQEAAQRLGEDRSTIANYLRLLELPDEIKQMLVGDGISMGHARGLLGVTDKNEQLTLARRIIKNNLSVRELERAVQKIRQGSENVPVEKPAKSVNIIDLEQQMTQSLGTKVIISTKGKKGHHGKITIEFYTLDDFDRIRERIL